MRKSSVVDFINKELKVYGFNIYGEKNFRVVYSDDQVENRKGTFEEYSGNIFVRTYTGIKEVKKYPWIKGKWILERWAPGELAYHKDLETDKNGVYVCVYIFQDICGDYLPPLLRICKI